MIRAVTLEFAKMRRLRTAPIMIVMVAAVAGLSSISLFSGGARASFGQEQALPWGALLLTYTFMAAMTSPILVAVLASRQTDIEHAASGWTLAATAGLGVGTLCRAKLLALSLVLLVGVGVQSLAVVGIGAAVGIRVPLDPWPWIGYTLLLFAVDGALLAVHVCLAALVDNQLVSVGVGVLGAFVAVFMLLVPAAVARVVPWGYYAMISSVGQHGGVVAFSTPDYPWIAGFLAAVGVAFVAFTRRLDRAGVGRVSG